MKMDAGNSGLCKMKLHLIPPHRDVLSASDEGLHPMSDSAPKPIQGHAVIIVALATET